MTLLHTISLFLAFFYACSTLKFSEIIENPVNSNEGLTVKEKSDTHIEMTIKDQAVSTLFLLVDKELSADTTSIFVHAIYNGKIIRPKVIGNSIETGLCRGSILVFGPNAHALKGYLALDENPPTIHDFVSDNLWRHSFPDFKGKLFAVAVKNDQPGPAIKFAEPVCGGYCRAGFGYPLKVKSNDYIEIHPMHADGYARFSLLDDGLYVDTANIFVYIHYGSKLNDCREDTKNGIIAAMDLGVHPGSLVIVGSLETQKMVDKALKQSLPLGDSSKSIDFWRSLLPKDDVNYSITIIPIEDGRVEEKEVPQEKKALPKKKPEKRKAEEGDANTDDSTGKSPPKKKRKLSPNHPGFDISEEGRSEKQPADGFSSDDSDAVEILAEQYPKSVLPKNDLGDIEIVQKDLSFNYLLEKIPEDGVKVFKTRALELEHTDEQINATAQVGFISPTTVRIIQTGGGVVIINDVQGIKNGTEMPLSDPFSERGDVSKPIVLNDSDGNIRIIDSYNVEVGDVIILLVPTSKNSTTKPMDWSFALINSQEEGGLIDVQEHFNSLAKKYKKEGIKVLCAVVTDQ